MVYGSETILPSDLRRNSPRVEQYNDAEAEAARQDNLDLLEEERELALIRSATYQQDLRRYHDKQVRGRAFQEGDPVLCLDQQKPYKMAPPWQGPFAISKLLHNGACRLYNLNNGTAEPITWSTDLLRKFYM